MLRETTQFTCRHLQHAAYYLTTAFAGVLSALPSHPSSRLSTILPNDLIFTLPAPPNSFDVSASAQCAELEACLGLRRRDGAAEMARRTGSKASPSALASQVVKLRTLDAASGGHAVLERTATICLESSLLASLFLGRSVMSLLRA